MKELKLSVTYENGVEIYNLGITLEELMQKGSAIVEKYGYKFVFSLNDKDAELPKTVYLEKDAEVEKVLEGIPDGSIDTNVFGIPVKTVPLSKEELRPKSIKSPKEVKQIITDFEKNEKQKEKQAEKAEEKSADSNNIPGVELLEKVLQNEEPKP
jgi:hypothetical protein